MGIVPQKDALYCVSDAEDRDDSSLFDRDGIGLCVFM